MPHQTQAMQQCIDACQSCHDVCLRMIRHCLSLGGKHAAPDHIRTLIDCAQICATSADFMVRESPLHAHTCRACADVCAPCAASCEQLGGAEMNQCAEECRRCAAACREMAQALA